MQKPSERTTIPDQSQLVGTLAFKMAEREGITLSIERQDEYQLWFHRAIFALQIIADADWLRFVAPGTPISEPGF